jgi:hypothetical protein
MSDTSADSSDSPNISKLREMALRGREYRETIDFTYYGENGELFVRPLTDPEFLPIAGFLEERIGIDPEEAQEALEEERDEETDTIDPSEFDREFVEIMHQAAVLGIDTEQGIAKGEDKEGVKEIVKMLQGGKSLVIAQRVMEMSSDAETAEKFRRDGGGE